MKKNIKNVLGSIYYNSYKRFKSKKGNRILLYHSIGTEINNDKYGFSISSDLFNDHIKFLKDNYKFLEISNEYKKKLDKETISITFDDGFYNNLKAAELLEKINCPYTIYITTDYIGRKMYLSKKDLNIISNFTNCTIGFHGHTHKPFNKLSKIELNNEIVEGKKILEDIIEKKIFHASYPHGIYDNSIIKLFKYYNFNTVACSRVGRNDNNNINAYCLRRNEIIKSDNLDQLSKKILGYYDFLEIRKYSSV